MKLLTQPTHIFTSLTAMMMWLSSMAFAQPFIRQVDPFTVQANGAAIALPFAGGINSPLHQFVDIDGDGDFDLFVLDNDLGFDFYRNDGTRFFPNFKLRNDVATLPKFSVWFRFVDLDGDGKKDLCTEDTTFQGVRVYKNVGSGQSLLFSLLIPTLKDTTGADVYTGGNSIPAFVDIDADGDSDLFSTNLTGTVNFYKNVGSRTLPRYAFVTSNWENILIFGDSCSTSLGPVRMNAHGAAAYTFVDIDGDGDSDMFIGDLFSSGVFSIRNVGTPQQPRMQCETSRFPQNDPLISGGFNQTSFADIDGDNDPDMFVGILGGIVQRDGFIFYRNIGDSIHPQFQRVTSNYLSTIDVGLNAHTAFADIDADGDNDMFVGNLTGQLTFFRNTGSITSPSFTLIDSAYLSVANDFYLSPAFVDIDDDGDKDLFAGMFYGTLKFFRNNGTLQNPQLALTPFVTDTIDVGSNATPAFVDIDNDGDKDLFIGNTGGRIRFYRNTGMASRFTPQLVTSTFLNIALGEDNYVTPTFSDYDNDGDFDFFFGAGDGRVEFYENTGTANDYQFVRRTSNFASTAPTQESAPTFADVDGDGDQDLFVGVRKGGIHFYRNNRIGTGVQAMGVPMTTELLQNYPNPFNPVTTVSFVIGHSALVSLKVFDLLGTEVAILVHQVLPEGSYALTWDAGNYPSGVYFSKLTTPSTSLTKKMILLK